MNATKIHDAAMSQMETCWLGCVTSQHIVWRIPEVSFDLDLWMDAKIRYSRSCVELAARTLLRSVVDLVLFLIQSS